MVLQFFHQICIAQKKMENLSIQSSNRLVINAGYYIRISMVHAKAPYIRSFPQDVTEIAKIWDELNVVY